MKKQLGISLVLLCTLSVLTAQTSLPDYLSVQSDLFRRNSTMDWATALTAHADPDAGSILIRTDSLQTGYNELGSNPLSGQKFYLIAELENKQLQVVAFALQYQNGKLDLLEPAPNRPGNLPPASFQHPALPIRIALTPGRAPRAEAILPEYEF